MVRIPDMDEHTLWVLEFDKIKLSLQGVCQSPLGQKEIDRITPGFNLVEIQKRLDQVQQMKEILLYQGGFPSLSVDDLSPVLARIKPEGTSLDPAELLSLAEILICVREILKFSKSIKGKYPLLEELTNKLRLPEKLLDSIQRSIEPNGEVKDSASAQLSRIRRGKVDLRQEVTSKLHTVLRSTKVRPEDEIITLRQGRYVISLPETELSKIRGIIQDRSGTGLTYYVEPVAVVGLNNKLKELELEERNEIHRILLSLTQLAREHLFELGLDLETWGELDSLAAKARLAIELKCSSPLLNQEKYLSLRKARHPFLDPRQVVPLSLELGKDFSTLVITGPNTGGKTVALKTIGLLCLMVQAGLQIPAEPDSTAGIFKGIFADIGDEQSIEMSLSTFSAHIRHIIEAVNQADRDSLVLIDEIGAGTDPQEGGALGEAILRYLTGKMAKTIVTTHLGALKVLAQNDPRIRNGSFEFDSASLRPTFQFRMGLPGSSYAVEIASRLGLNPEIVSQASALIGTQEKDLTSLLGQLDQKLEKEQKEIKRKSLSEARELLAKSRLQIEHLIKELREKKAEKESIKKALSFVQEQTKQIEQEAVKYQPQKLIRMEKIHIGGRVWVQSLKSEGEVLSWPDKSGKLKVQVGGLSVTLGVEDLYQSEEPQKPRLGKTKFTTETESVPQQLRIRGMTADEALEKEDKYLDQALLAGLTEVSIIHGKGTGTLRKKVTQFLKDHPRVEDTRLAEWDKGGSGVTLVRLKKG